MLIVKYQTEGPFLADTLENCPEMELSIEEQYRDDNTASFILWADGGDFDAFEACLAADPSVSASRTLTDLGQRRLYQVTCTEQIHETATLPEWGDLGLVFLEGNVTSGEWTFRMGFPDREALERFQRLHQDRNRPFRLRTIYDEVNTRDEKAALLTDAQQEALAAAYEAGHFDVPQRASQSDVASRLNISPQALSERLQRGIRTLVEMTVVGQ